MKNTNDSFERLSATSVQRRKSLLEILALCVMHPERCQGSCFKGGGDVLSVNEPFSISLVKNVRNQLNLTESAL